MIYAVTAYVLATIIWIAYLVSLRARIARTAGERASARR